MKKFRVLFSILITILIALYLLYAPQIIMKGIKQSRVSRWENKQEDFAGIIDVWHIVSFKAHTGSVSSWIAARASEIEEKYFGVFINVSAMTVDEYIARVERGERADIYSFPLGLEYSDKFLPPEYDSITPALNAIRSSLIHTGQYEGVLYALPYMYSGYCFVVNNTLMQKANIDISQTPDELANTAGTLSKDDYNAICGDEVYVCRYGVKSELGLLDDFKTGSAHMAFADFRMVGDIERKQSSGKGFPITAYATDSYTDLVQYIALDSKIESEKLKYAYELINCLFSQEAQEKLSVLNAYSVTEYEDVEKRRDLYKSIAYDAFSVYAEPIVPNCFLYKRYKSTLYEDAHAALSGDEDAYTRFNERMNELIKP